jgi:hypothetical protein
MRTMSKSGTNRILTEVGVPAAVLHSAADLIDAVVGFLTDAGPATRTQLGSYLIAHRDIEGTGDPAIAAAIMAVQLGEAAGLLHALAGPAD